MGRIVSRVGWIVVIAVLVGAFSIFAYNIGYRAGHDEVTVSGEKQLVDPEGAPPVSVAEGVVVGPAGLAIPAYPTARR